MDLASQFRARTKGQVGYGGRGQGVGGIVSVSEILVKHKAATQHDTTASMRGGAVRGKGR
jgi:hypothetical protein